MPPSPPERWPALPYDAWSDTCQTLHLWLQIVGKIRLRYTPWVNHQWHVTQYVTARGLTTSPIPHPQGVVQLDFDFLDHVLRITGEEGAERRLTLEPRSVADFHTGLLGVLEAMGRPVEIHGAPNEVPDPIPFAEDHKHAAYDPDSAHRFWRAVAASAQVFRDFRADYVGKCSPVHFFWGGMDLAVTRFSGRKAPEHPGGIPHLPDWVTREAYSHEVSSVGFWPGGPAHPEPIFYAYAYPEPDGFRDLRVEPGDARWSDVLQEFILPYDAVRQARDPEATLKAFLQSTYEGAAELADWDRERLEWGHRGRPPWND
jgi:hypothetical protein